MSAKHSAITHFGSYPAFINLTVDKETNAFKVTVRSGSKPGGECGDIATITLTRGEWSQLLAGLAGD